MGRPPWATPEQTAFLKGFLPDLDCKKMGNGLKVFYDCVTRDFLARWPAEPSSEDQKETNDELKLKELASAQ